MAWPSNRENAVLPRSNALIQRIFLQEMYFLLGPLKATLRSKMQDNGSPVTFGLSRVPGQSHL